MITCCFSCSVQDENENGALFTLLKADKAGIDFSNDLKITEEYNPYTFKNFFNGGGVAVGDINNDNLSDIYFTGNLVENKLFLNKGDLKFEDISKLSGTECSDVWSTGAAMVDINHDGFLDIYVCKSGKPNVANRKNQFFINNGDMTFTDKASEYNLDFEGLSVHSAFFDYDKDGDLDCYLLNNSIRSVGAYDIAEGLRDIPSTNGNKLLKNLEVETGKIRFEDVSLTSGIYTSNIGFGLGVSISDLNNDSWPDIFVSNDFFEKDYMYLNNKDGTFIEVIADAVEELSMGSMGADIADMNGDLLPDIFVTEMLPEGLDRYKTKTSFDAYDKYVSNTDNGYHRQFGRNVFLMNTGINNKGIYLYQDLSRYHKVEASDWSWGALLFDMDNNGERDIFIANGIKKDLLDQDHINFYTTEMIGKMVKKERSNVITTIMDNLPSEKLYNHFYLQDSGVFMKQNNLLFDTKDFSNGSAYCDLDGDGDLELIVNTIDEPAKIYLNNAEANFLTVSLNGEGYNLGALGSKVTVFFNNNSSILELNPMRGYQSCVSHDLNFGLGDIEKVDSLIVEWWDGRMTNIRNPKINTRVEIDIKNSEYIKKSRSETIRKTLLSKIENIIDYTHKENLFSDFDKNRTLISMSSNLGPRISIVDINKDGQEDVVIPGAMGDGSKVFIQKRGKLVESSILSESEFDNSETQKILAEDFDLNGGLDFLFCNGGMEFNSISSNTRDYLSLDNDGNSDIQTTYKNSRDACFLDIDGDKSNEIVIATGFTSDNVGVPPSSLVYKYNKGEYIPDKNLSDPLANIGSISQVSKSDIDGDGRDDLVFSSEWNSIKVFSTKDKRLVDISEELKLDKTKGFWTDIEITDIDNDGDQDIIAANIGLNNRLYSLSGGNIYFIANDFDQNGMVEVITCIKKGDSYFPIHLRKDLVQQTPIVKKKALKFSDYGRATLADLYDPNVLKRSIIYHVNEFRSGIFILDNGIYSFKPFPEPIQYSEQKAIYAGNINNDGYTDIIIGGNQYNMKPEIGINAASYGHVLLNNKDRTFDDIHPNNSGFVEKGQIRDIQGIMINDERHILVMKNNDKASVYKLENHNKKSEE